MTLTLRAQAFGPLANVEWTIPPGVSAVVGPNRAGKSTLLALPEFIRIAMGQSLNDAVKRVFDGPAYLRTFGLPSGALAPSTVNVTASLSIWVIARFPLFVSLMPCSCMEQMERRL